MNADDCEATCSSCSTCAHISGRLSASTSRQHLCNDGNDRVVLHTDRPGILRQGALRLVSRLPGSWHWALEPKGWVGQLRGRMAVMLVRRLLLLER